MMGASVPEYRVATRSSWRQGVMEVWDHGLACQGGKDVDVL